MAFWQNLLSGLAILGHKEPQNLLKPSLHVWQVQQVAFGLI